MFTQFQQTLKHKYLIVRKKFTILSFHYIYHILSQFKGRIFKVKIPSRAVSKHKSKINMYYMSLPI